MAEAIIRPHTDDSPLRAHRLQEFCRARGIGAMMPHLQHCGPRLDAIRQQLLLLLTDEVAGKEETRLAVAHAVDIRGFVSRSFFRRRRRKKHLDRHAIYGQLFSCMRDMQLLQHWLLPAEMPLEMMVLRVSGPMCIIFVPVSASWWLFVTATE